MISSRLRAVDATRGLAAGLVFLHHLDVFFPTTLIAVLGRDSVAHHILKALSSLNAEAVMLFFVISGFCIRATSRQYDFSRRSDVLNYARRRAARILPLYIGILAFTYVNGVFIGQSGGPSYSATTLIGNLLFLQGPVFAKGMWFLPFGENRPLWSISFEVFYYALFPVAVLFELRHTGQLGDRGRLVAIFASFVFSWLSLFLYNLVPNPIFLFASAYCVWRIGVAAEDLRRGQGQTAPVLALLVGMVLLMCAIMLIHESDTLWIVMEGTALGAVWIILQANPVFARSLAIRPFGAISKLLASLGGISYGLYLIHYPLIQLGLYLFADSRAGFAFSIVMSLVLAWLVETAADRAKGLLLASKGQQPIVTTGPDCRVHHRTRIGTVDRSK